MAHRILIIDGHPDPDRARLCHALADAYADGARSMGKEVRLISVADVDFELLRTAAQFASPPDHAAVLRARADLMWCDHLVLVFPLWLGDAPALLRGFLEHVARASFVAAGDGTGLQQKLKGRSARLIITMGMPSLIYRMVFHAHGLKAIMQGVLNMGGIRPIKATLFGAIEATPRQQQKRRIDAVEELGRAGA